MNIGDAVAFAKAGRRIRRAGWNGKGMYVYLTIPHEQGVDPYMVMHTAQGTEQPGWLCSQADLLSNDWELAD